MRQHVRVQCKNNSETGDVSSPLESGGWPRVQAPFFLTQK